MTISIDALLQANASTVTCVHVQDIDGLLSHLKERICDVFLADADQGDSKKTFFSIASALPTSPPYEELHRSINMGAFADSLWGGVGAIENDVVLLVNNAEILVQDDVNMLLTLCGIFISLDSLKRKYNVSGKIVVLLLGAGRNFIDASYGVR